MAPNGELPMTHLSPEELRNLLRDISAVRVAVLGDFCLDVYWTVDPAAAEMSLETGLETRPVARQRCTLGGAGNVVANLRALGCSQVHAFGVVGDDPWGHELLVLLRQGGARTDGMLTARERWSTLVYVKPHWHDEESHRFDFGNFNSLPAPLAEALLRDVEDVLPRVDALIVNQQVRQGIHTPFLQRRLSDLIHAHPDKIVVVDSRHISDAYAGAILKLNDHEATRLIGLDHAPEALIPRNEAVDSAEQLWHRWGKPVFVTRGTQGIIVRDADGLRDIPGLRIPGKIDTVGAGDSVLSGLTLALAAGRSPATAAEFGGLVAAVTVRKLRQTGAASPDEVLAVRREADSVESAT